MFYFFCVLFLYNSRGSIWCQFYVFNMFFIQIVCSEHVPNLTLLASLLAYFGVCFWKAHMGITGKILVWPVSILVVEEGKIKVSSSCSSKRTAMKSFLAIISLTFYTCSHWPLVSVRQLVIFCCRIHELLCIDK